MFREWQKERCRNCGKEITFYRDAWKHYADQELCYPGGGDKGIFTRGEPAEGGAALMEEEDYDGPCV